MAMKRKSDGRGPADRQRVARAVFSAAEAMGISDRKLLEAFTDQVIQRLEQATPLPGMEDLVTRQPRGGVASESQIQALVREILSSKERPMERATTTTTMQLTPNARVVLERRYLKKDGQGKVVETPEDMFRRVARNIASADLIYDGQANIRATEEEFYQVIANLEFLPNSPTLMNAGLELQQLSACFVLPVDDSMEAIFEAVKQTALIHKSGGGTGFSFSRLRPAGDKVGSTGGVASGPVSFMRAFDTATDVTKQGGTRRGANMGILNYNHPDIMQFITAKEKGAFTNFNISVAVTSEFMEKVERGEDYDLINPRSGQAVGKLNARQVFNKIVDMAWRTGDPGVVFLDAINRANPTPHLGKIESTNPCGEQPLLPYESCNLGSLNLARLLRYQDGKAEIDYEKLGRVVETAVHFLDNVIDVNRYPIPEIARVTKSNRKIGLGIMGFADMLIQMGIPYDSEEALKAGEEVMKFISQRADQASARLAEARGTFPAFQGSIYDRPGGLKVRNATRTTIAPTGTLSIIAGSSSGIEPLFALTYERHILDNERFLEVNPYFEEVAKKEGFHKPELTEELARGKRLRDIEGVPDWVKRLFVTAHDITPEWHVRMQAAFQKHTDNAVSKTVNFPHDATKEDVAKVFRLAYKLGLKGITIYRDRSLESQVLTLGQGDVSVEEEEAEHGHIHFGEIGLTPRPRPEETTSGYSRKVRTGCGNLYVMINSDEKGICDVFASLGKAGGCASAQLEATGRLISIAMRSGLDPEAIVKMLKGIRCPSINWEGGHAVLSCADAIASVLEKYLEKTGKGPGPAAVMDTKLPAGFGPTVNLAGQCPDCGSLLIYQEGCLHCHSCGYTKC